KEDAEEQAKLVRSLVGGESPLATKLFQLWKEGGIFIYTAPDSKRVPVTLGEKKDDEGKTQAFRVSDGKPLAGEDGKPLWVAATQGALDAIAGHLRIVNTVGTLFRGLSLGSILLVVAIGLAITFGLMGVINMAHGELLVVGAYTTYVVHGFFATGVILQIPT